MIMAKTEATKGFLLVLMQPPPSLEDEFNAWYDTEHLAERLAVPGFETALRFVCIDGHPRYLAMYDLTHFGVLETEAYRRVGYDRASPWTRRVTSRVRIYRSAGEQIYSSGDSVTKRASRVRLLRFRGLKRSDAEEIVARMRTAYAGLPEVSQVRVLAYDTGLDSQGEGFDYLGLVEARAPITAPLDVSVFGVHADALDLVNTYAPY